MKLANMRGEIDYGLDYTLVLLVKNRRIIWSFMVRPMFLDEEPGRVKHKGF